MKKILIISYLFAPNNSVGSIRPTKLTKYLNKLGYEVDVITADLGLNYASDFSNDIRHVDNLWVISGKNKQIPYKLIGTYQDSNSPVICQNNDIDDKSTKKSKQMPKLKNTYKSVQSISRKISDFKSRQNSKQMLKLKNMYRTFLLINSSRIFVTNFKKLICSSDFNGDKYDAVLSTFGPIHSILSGMVFKNNFEKIPWICDFRDPMVVEETPLFFRSYFSYLQNKMCEKADMVTTVSEGYYKRISKGRHQDKFRIIPNGYDKDDNLKEKSVIRDKFTLTYVGSLYEGKRDLTPIFRVIRELVDAEVIDICNISFNYAGNDNLFLLLQAEKYNLSKIINNYGSLSRSECLKLQFESRFLVLSTWNNKNEEGVFPGKFLEYMLINKPIIAVVDGNLPNSEVKSVMDEAMLGVTYEAVEHETNYIQLKKYIKHEYLRFQSGLDSDFYPNRDVIQRYDYEKIVLQFDDIISRVGSS